MDSITRVRKIKSLAQQLVEELDKLENDLGPSDDSESPVLDNISPDVISGLQGLIKGFED